MSRTCARAGLAVRAASDLRAMAKRATASSKLRNVVGRLSGVSDRALARIVALLGEEDEDPESLRHSIRRGVEATFDQPTPYGAIFKWLTLPNVESGAPGIKVSYICPKAFLHWLVLQSPKGFQALQQASVGRETLSLMIYNDGATCGNMLDVDQSKKMEVFYFSFLELGCPCPTVLAW